MRKWVTPVKQHNATSQNLLFLTRFCFSWRYFLIMPIILKNEARSLIPVTLARLLFAITCFLWTVRMLYDTCFSTVDGRFQWYDSSYYLWRGTFIEISLLNSIGFFIRKKPRSNAQLSSSFPSYSLAHFKVNTKHFLKYFLS